MVTVLSLDVSQESLTISRMVALYMRVPNRFCGMRDGDYFGNGKRDVCKNSERDY